MSEPVQTDISAEILALGAETKAEATHVPGANGKSQPVSSPAGPSVEMDFIVGEKVYKPHKALLDRGVHPRDIPHIAYGRWKGCQHLGCKQARGEMVPAKSAPGRLTDPAADAFKDLIDEEIAAAILNTPNRMGEIFCRVKKLPKEALDVWDVPEKELRVYGRLGKRVADIYLNLPEFKHKELVLLGVYMGAQLSMRATTTLLILKTMEERK